MNPRGQLFTGVALGLVVGIAAGFLAARLTLLPAARDNSTKTAAVDASAPASPAASSSAPHSSDAAPQDSPSSGGKNKCQPLTAKSLIDELQDMERSGSFGISGMGKFAMIQERLNSSDLPALARELLAQNPQAAAGGVAPSTALHLVLSALAEKDPAAAWATASAVQNPALRRDALFSIASGVAAKQPELVLSWAEAIPDAQTKNQLRALAINSLANSNPQRALDLALSSKSGGDGNFNFSVFSIFSRWARTDLDAAKAALKRLDPDSSAQAVNAIASTLAQSDIRSAWQFAQEMAAKSGGAARSGRRVYNDPRAQVLSQWAMSDPLGALQAAATIEDPRVRSSSISSTIQQWANTDFPAALDYAIRIPDARSRADAIQNLVHNQNADPARMLQAVLDYFPSGDSFHITISSLFSTWSSTDPRAAGAALQSLPPGRGLSSAASNVASNWMRTANDPGEVLRWAQSLPAGDPRNNAIQSALAALAEKDPAAAARALGQISEGRSSAQDSVASAWARSDPRAALKWASGFNDPDQRSSAIQRVIQQWAHDDPESAAAALSGLPLDIQSGAMESLIHAWASSDLESAADWLDRQAPGPHKDRAIGRVAEKVAEDDPESAIAWVNTISDTKYRIQQAERIARAWLRADPDTARAWITANLPEENRKKLLK